MENLSSEAGGGGGGGGRGGGEEEEERRRAGEGEWNGHPTNITNLLPILSMRLTFFLELSRILKFLAFSSNHKTHPHTHTQDVQIRLFLVEKKEFSKLFVGVTILHLMP